MALSQRHFKRLLAYSTIAHVGLFLVALACLSVSGTAGALLYVAGHAAVKGALFLIAGVMLAQYGSVDEYDLYGRGTGDKAHGRGARRRCAGPLLASRPSARRWARR